MPAPQDTCCSIAPYFKVNEGQLPAFKALCRKFVAASSGEKGCLYYGFTFNGDEAHCREGYVNADALLTHLDNVKDLLESSLQIAELTHLEIHGPASELARLREPLAAMNPRFFQLEDGFRRS
ncbi:MAG: hypothetical protein RQ899_14195 [Pseudomonadales bacterium]|nr:hypothetical protein [Pseudomonadales bacterium]